MLQPSDFYSNQNSCSVILFWYNLCLWNRWKQTTLQMLMYLPFIQALVGCICTQTVGNLIQFIKGRCIQLPSVLNTITASHSGYTRKWYPLYRKWYAYRNRYWCRNNTFIVLEMLQFLLYSLVPIIIYYMVDFLQRVEKKQSITDLWWQYLGFIMWVQVQHWSFLYCIKFFDMLDHAIFTPDFESRWNCILWNAYFKQNVTGGNNLINVIWVNFLLWYEICYYINHDLSKTVGLSTRRIKMQIPSSL